jgi:hypothetical protein
MAPYFPTHLSSKSLYPTPTKAALQISDLDVELCANIWGGDSVELFFKMTYVLHHHFCIHLGVTRVTTRALNHGYTLKQRMQ